MQAPIERMLDQVEWSPAEYEKPPAGDLPYATHSGVLTIGDMSLRCYRLNTGQAIIYGEDMKNSLGSF